MAIPVVHFEIIGNDAKTLQKFYKEAFDWQIDPPSAAVGAKNYGLVHAKAGVGIDGGIGDMGGVNGYVAHDSESPSPAAVGSPWMYSHPKNIIHPKLRPADRAEPSAADQLQV